MKVHATQKKGMCLVRLKCLPCEFGLNQNAFAWRMLNRNIIYSINVEKLGNSYYKPKDFD